MILTTSFFSISILIAAAILILSSLIRIKTIQDREKSSPFECGFDPKKSARIPFSLRFFLLTILFLIFDIEIVLILPIITTAKSSSTSYVIWRGTIFFIILLLGLLHEWNEGSLEWSS